MKTNMIIQSRKTNEKEIQPIQSGMGSTCSSGSGTLDLIRIFLLIIQYLLSNLIETWQIVERLRQYNKHLVQDQKKLMLLWQEVLVLRKKVVHLGKKNESLEEKNG